MIVRLSSLRASVLAFLLLIAPTEVRSNAVLAPGEALTEQHLSSLVTNALPPGELFDITFTSPSLPLANPADSKARLELLDFQLDAKNERFEGRFRVELDSGETGILALTGTARTMVEVMVPARVIATGERLTSLMLEPILVEVRRLRSDTITDIAQLNDVEASRRLPPGRPIRKKDVQELRLVRRGDTVEVLYRAPGIELTTLARALDDGGRGTVIKVANLDSGQRLSAIVSSHGQVTVGPVRSKR